MMKQHSTEQWDLTKETPQAEKSGEYQISHLFKWHKTILLKEGILEEGIPEEDHLEEDHLEEYGDHHPGQPLHL